MFFIFQDWAEKSISRNIRKALFWENIRSLLILESESSIPRHIKNFFQGGFLWFFELVSKSVPGSCILYYSWAENGIFLLFVCGRKNILTALKLL